MNNKDLEQMILQELVLQPILEFIVDKFAEELLKEDEEGNGGFSNVDNLANQGQNTQQVSALSDGSGLKTPCVGSYPVSGYTRSDGTEVKPYVRTCGAKHLVQEKEKKENKNITGGASNMDEFLPYNTTPWNSPYVTTSSYDDYQLKNELIKFNNQENKNYKDARDLMNIALNNPNNIKQTLEYKKLNNIELDELSKFLKYKFNNNNATIKFNPQSSLATSISNSQNLHIAIKNWCDTPIQLREDTIQVKLDDNTNLFRAINNATILNPRVENGLFTGYLYDVYDFKFEKFSDLYTTIVNNSAVILQAVKLIKNYNIIVPIKIKLK